MGGIANNRRTGGVTLAEIIVALGIFSVIALSMMSLLLSGRTASQSGADSAAAVGVATGELDRLRTQPNSVLVGYLTTALPGYNVTNGDRTYGVNLTVSRLGATEPEFSMLDLALSVNWQQKQSIDQRGVVHQATRTLVQHTTVTPLVNY